MCAQVKLLREALGTEGESLAQNVQQVCDLLELQEDGQAPTQDQVKNAAVPISAWTFAVWAPCVYNLVLEARLMGLLL